MKKRIFVMLLCLCMLVTCFAGCGGKKETGTPATTQDETTTGDSAPNYSGRLLDVLFMVGGQRQMADPILAKLEEVLPGLETKIVYDHNAGDILRSRVMANDAPDIFDVNTGTYDYYAAIEEGVMKPLDFLYDVPCVDDPSKTIGDILNFSMLTFGYVDGKHYTMRDTVYTSGLWYDANMFREKGYEVPKTWDEFVALGEKAKADGKYLLCYSTKYGQEYFYNYWFNPLVCSIDIEAFGRMQRLEENAYSDPAIREALERTKMLIDKGYVDTVSGTLEITETQMEFCNGNILFYPCGSWLEAEMEGNWPDGFELTYIPFPPNKAGDPSYLSVSGVVSAVSATTKNLDLVKEYYRYMLSHKETTRKVVEITMNGLAIADFSKNFGDILPHSVSSSWAAIDSGQCIGVLDQSRSFYPGIRDVITNSISAFNAGDLDVDGYINTMNEFYNNTRNDDSIIKRDYDMSAIMKALTEYKLK
jgi:N-acetylglucosamine transport system substrate-binding protein